MHKLKNPVFWLRLTLGWLFLYAGISKITDPNWSAEGFLKGAKTLPQLYSWFALPTNIGWVNFLNEWGLTLLGISLILGLAIRWSTYLGVLLMILYYLPGLQFPYAEHGFLVDEHIIFILVLCLIKKQTDQHWNLKNILHFKKK